MKTNSTRRVKRSIRGVILWHAALLITAAHVVSCSSTSVRDSGPGRVPVPIAAFVDSEFKDLSPRAKPAEITDVKDQQDEKRAEDALMRKGYVRIGWVSGRSVPDKSLYGTLADASAKRGADAVLLRSTEERANVTTSTTTAGTGSYYQQGGDLVRGSSTDYEFNHYEFNNYSGSLWRYDPARAAAKIELLEGLTAPGRLERFLNSETFRSAAVPASELNALVGRNVARINGRSFKLLVKAGANSRLSDGQSLMALAIYTGNVSLAQALLDSGEPLAIGNATAPFNCKDAVNMGQLPTKMQYLCSGQVDQAAILSGQPAMLEFVASRGALKLRAGKNGHSALGFAALADQPEMIEKLLQIAGKEYKREDLNGALVTAISNKSANAAVKLLRKGANPNTKADNYNTDVTMLMHAVNAINHPVYSETQPELVVIKALLDAGADPNVKGGYRYVTKNSQDGCTPLQMAILEWGEKNLLADLLRKHGARSMSAEECSNYRQSRMPKM